MRRLLILAALALSLPLAHAARPNLVLGMTLEPPGLDPTANASAAIAEIVQYNVFETLTKINADGKVTPLLATDWAMGDPLTWTFHLRRDVKFQNGEPCNAVAVKFSFERAAAAASTNKDRRLFSNMAVATPDPWTVVLTLKTPEPDLLFMLGQATAVIVEPKSAASNGTAPVGTGPYMLDAWAKGSQLSLKASPGWRGAAAAKGLIPRVSFRFIGDPAAQVAALLSGDVDAFPRAAVARSLDQFKADPRFQVIRNPSRAKTILAINHKRKPLDDIRVRQAIAAAIDRKAVIEAAADGFGVPIGSHYVPGAPGYVDLTGLNTFDPVRAKTLLKDASYALNFPRPLPLTLKLPPTPYARQSGELIAAELAKAGMAVKVENIEWAQWMSGVYTAHNYDLTLISHVEPLDLGNYAKPGYYWGYESAEFNQLHARIGSAPDEATRLKLLGEAQKLLARDVAAVYLYQPLWITVANKSLKGLWVDMPVFVNDLAALHWE
ncbi:ABC transporter substrate-binding protein [Pelomonas sp. KK5]|uniref:ABC transporter substrate-binding protein n=1 Tax=Pelomonas sp. KK5 TaxID=1855730 RepID=UPI00097C749B|nr:ABC transporter substrate-binding protein [Pelomonas sp. KK5]